MIPTPDIHPRQALFDAEDLPPLLPVCDHYAGLPKLMEKSLALQGEKGPIFDLTLDCEDGAPVGGEAEHAHLVGELVMSPANLHGRVGVRVHPWGHPAFRSDVATLLRTAGRRLAYVMVPKPQGSADVEAACAFIAQTSSGLGFTPPPVHVLVETHGALAAVSAIAAHPQVESVSFGLMDFVSAHRGAIPFSAMSAIGQFSHPLVVRAKLEISAACHAHGKTPSHGVITEFKDRNALSGAAERACKELGYTRMWSIHPQQIDLIVEAFSPSAAELDLAVEVIQAAQGQSWGPLQHRQALHDRASFRYFWMVIERAHQTGQLPVELQQLWFA
ncbi:MAG: aldolase/citrate lyase family protein [Pseudomonadota bacterium]